MFADVILPLALERNYTYGVPIEMQATLQVGCRVEVQLGKRKVYSGIVKKIHSQKPEFYEIKPIRQMLDDEPIVTPQQIVFWEWLATYYACTEGEVMNAALPTHLKLVSETHVVIHPDLDIQSLDISDDEFLILQALEIRAQQIQDEANS